MEKTEMSFIEKFKKACDELENAKGEKCHMIMLAFDDESEKVFACINGDVHELSVLLSYATLKDDGFKKIFTLAMETIKIKEQENNK